jgi:hydrogenase nickel incorporation protein HypB
MQETQKTVDVRKKVLEENSRRAEEIRARFAQQGTLVLNLISSPGSGKTTLLEATVAALRERYRIAAIEGDIATERDAERLRAMRIPAHQILTGGACHLDARQVHDALERMELGPMDFLFIENVGNLICPTSYDLGEDFKVALLSVVEGHDKPFKYPGIFARAQVTAVTKADLLPHTDFRLDEVRQQVRSLRPDGQIVVTSVRGDPGIGEWLGLIEDALARKRRAARQ